MKEASAIRPVQLPEAQPSSWMPNRLFRGVKLSTFGHPIDLAWALEASSSTISIEKLVHSSAFLLVELETCLESCFELRLCWLHPWSLPSLMLGLSCLPPSSLL